MSRLAGGRLPASYVNYLLVNGGIVMPSFGVPEDSAAAVLLGRLYRHRRLVQVPSLFFVFYAFFLSFLAFSEDSAVVEAPSPIVPSQAASTAALFFWRTARQLLSRFYLGRLVYSLCIL